MKKAGYWIKNLCLRKHPEGGYFRETYAAKDEIGVCCLKSGYDGPRPVSTAIYFLLPGDEFSAFHRLRSDEIWHHYDGASLTIEIIAQDGGYRKVVLGPDYENGEQPQVLISAGVWFAAHLNDKNSFTLSGCTVAPGFNFRDFELGRRAELIKEYPEHKQLIIQLTHSFPDKKFYRGERKDR